MNNAYHKFLIDTLVENPKIMMIGPRASDKSFVIRDILRKLKDTTITAISPSERYNKFYTDIKNVKIVYYKYDPAIIEDLRQYNQRNNDNKSDDVMTDRIKIMLNNINTIVEASLTNERLDFVNLVMIKEITDALIDYKEKQEIRKTLRLTHDSIGKLLNKEDISENDLNILQNSITNLVKADQAILPNKYTCSKQMIVLDDCLNSGNYAKDHSLYEILTNGKSMNISSIIATQIPISLAAEIRQQFDYIILFAGIYLQSLKKIYEQYLQEIFLTFEDFNEVYIQLTSNNKCIVINVNGKKIFWYKTIDRDLPDTEMMAGLIGA
jgi:hypothetical protein